MNNRNGEKKMNETIRNIMNRRSIRNYKEEQIKDEELQADSHQVQ